MEMVLTCVHAFLLAPPNWAATEDALRAWQRLLLQIRLARRQPLVLELRTDRAIGRIEICLLDRCVGLLREEGRNYLNDLRGMVHVFGRLPRPGPDRLFDVGGQVDMTHVVAVVDVIRGAVDSSGGEESSEDEDM
jgi:hypothetical protein